MYKILGYSGGVYRFNEIIEFVEDNGGIILKRDVFEISRGAYFISQEVHVIIVIPEEALNDLKIIVEELKGDIEYLELEDEQKIAVISLLPVYNVLSCSGRWVDMKTLENMIQCPCLGDVCNELKGVTCIKLEKTLNAMCRMGIAEKRISGENKEFHLVG